MSCCEAKINYNVVPRTFPTAYLRAQNREQLSYDPYLVTSIPE